MKSLTYLLILGFLPLMASASKPLEYMCTPDDAATQITFRGKAFAISITDTCINLRSLENKSNDWSWRVTLKNSLGDKEGARQFCDKPDDGWIGYPALWRQDKLKFIAFDPAKIPNSFSCYELNKGK